jgi:hypothetical protein
MSSNKRLWLFPGSCLTFLRLLSIVAASGIV